MKAPEPYLVWRDPEPTPGTEPPQALTRPAVNRWLKRAAALTLLVIALPPLPYLVSPLWLISMATGYGAAALIIVLMLLPLRRLTQWPGERMSVDRHKRLAELALALSVVHTVVLLAGETLTFEYIWPSQPRFMIAGNIGLIVLALLVVTSLERVRVRLFGSRARFRPIHVGAAIALVVLVAAHMVGSGIFVAHPVKAALVALIAAASVAAALRRPKSRLEPEMLETGVTDQDRGKQPA